MTGLIPAQQCTCQPGLVCPPCAARGYRNGLAGYAARIHPQQVRQGDIDDQDRADKTGADQALARDEIGFPCKVCLRGTGTYCCCVTRCGAQGCKGATL